MKNFKGIIGSLKWKDRLYNGQTEKDKRTKGQTEEIMSNTYPTKNEL